MDAITKTPVTQEQAQAIIAAHYGSQSRITVYTELTDGMANAAYHIVMANGQQCVMKVAPADTVRVLRYERNIMQAEVDVLRLLRAQTDVPVPEVFAHDRSRTLIDNDYYLMTYIPGVALNKLRKQLTGEEQHAIDFRTGAYLRQMNSIAATQFGYFAQPQYHAASWRAAFETMLQHILQDGKDAGVELPLPYDEVYAKVQPHLSALDVITQPVLVHWDLWDGNIFIDPESKAITGILDCERALWGDPLMEVNFGPFGHNAALFEGYGEDMLATRNAHSRRALYNLYLWLIMIIECTYRQYPNDNQLTWVAPKLVEELNGLEKLTSG